MLQAKGILGMWRVAMWGGAAVLLSLPAFAMSFFPDAGVNWTGSDFVVMGAMLFTACATVEVGARFAGDWSYLAGVICAVGAGFATVWANLAVGMIGDEDNAANLVFLGVLALPVLGALAVRLQARGMAKAMLATAAAQLLVGLYVATAGLDRPKTALLIASFALPWCLAAYLFQLSANGRATLARA